MAGASPVSAQMWTGDRRAEAESASRAARQVPALAAMHPIETADAAAQTEPDPKTQRERAFEVVARALDTQLHAAKIAQDEQVCVVRHGAASQP